MYWGKLVSHGAARSGLDGSAIQASPWSMAPDRPGMGAQIVATGLMITVLHLWARQ